MSAGKQVMEPALGTSEVTKEVNVRRFALLEPFHVNLRLYCEPYHENAQMGIRIRNSDSHPYSMNHQT